MGLGWLWHSLVCTKSACTPNPLYNLPGLSHLPCLDFPLIWIGKLPLSPRVHSPVLCLAWLISHEHWILYPLAKTTQFSMHLSHIPVELLVPGWHCAPGITTCGPNGLYLSLRGLNCSYGGNRRPHLHLTDVTRSLFAFLHRLEPS